MMSASGLVRAAAVAALIAGAELDNHTLVLVIGLPKSGTISLQRFFASADCGARAASHYTCGPKGSPTEYCGAAIRANLEAGVAPLLGLEAFDVHTELDYLGDGGGGGPGCFFPQVDALEALVDGYPSATLVLNVRPVERWIASVSRFPQAAGGRVSFREALVACEIAGLARGVGSRDDELRTFYEAHSARVRAVAARRGARLVEVDIESGAAAAQTLEVRDLVPRRFLRDT